MKRANAPRKSSHDFLHPQNQENNSIKVMPMHCVSSFLHYMDIEPATKNSEFKNYEFIVATMVRVACG
jgi:hypothetical protein